VYDSIVNKTAISYKANRKIGGNAPSDYLKQIETDKAAQLQPAAMDAILQTHCIASKFLRTDDFYGFMTARRATLLSLVEKAIGKVAVASGEMPSEDDSTDEDEE
jgi:hypothetical protein